MGTVAVQRGFLGLSVPALRQYGAMISVTFGDGGTIVKTGGPPGPYPISDLGDAVIQGDPAVRFDLYRWDTNANAFLFGIRSVTATVIFPFALGASCPPGWNVVGG